MLEVDSLGFRLLKPLTLDALRAFGWGEIHSWLHSPGRFSFRYYDDRWSSLEQTSQHASCIRRDTLKFGVHCCRSQKIEECAFKIQQVDQLLASMEVFIDSVMTQRKVAWNYISTRLKKRLPMNAQKVFTDHAFVHKAHVICAGRCHHR